MYIVVLRVHYNMLSEDYGALSIYCSYTDMHKRASERAEDDNSWKCDFSCSKLFKTYVIVSVLNDM